MGRDGPGGAAGRLDQQPVVVADALPILTASVVALAVAVLTGTLAPDKAYSGFANGTILLIVGIGLILVGLIAMVAGGRSKTIVQDTVQMFLHLHVQTLASGARDVWFTLCCQGPYRAFASSILLPCYCVGVQGLDVQCK